jgi:hypothetical protein
MMWSLLANFLEIAVLHVLVPVLTMVLSVADTKPSDQRNGDLVAHESGKDILAKCTASNKSDEAVCLAYVAGVADEMSYDFVLNKKARCPPPGVGADQLRDTVVAYLKAHPEEGEYAAVAGVASAYKEGWCNLLNHSP